MLICTCCNNTFQSKKALSGHLGALASKNIHNNRYKKVVQSYEDSPSVCTYCNNVIPYKQRRNKFCSKSCSAMYNNPLKLSRKKTTKCKNCNNSFKLSYKSDKRIFCSTTCSFEHRKKITTENIIKGKVNSRRMLRLYLINIRGHSCEICHNSMWGDVAIPLELNHKNGLSNDNNLQNLEIICPNCHALTETYKGKNRGQGRKSLGLPQH